MKAIHLLAPFCLGVTLTALAADTAIPNPPGYAPDGATPLPPAYRAAPESAYFIEIKGGWFTSRSKERKQALLKNLVDVLRERYPDANLVVSPEVMQLDIAELKLRDASLEDTLEALSVASGGGFIWEKRLPRPAGYGTPGMVGMPTAIDPTTGLPLPPTAPAAPEADSSGLFILRSPDAPPDIRRTVMAFNLGGYLKGQSREDIDKSLDQLLRIIGDTLQALNAGRPEPSRGRDFTPRFHAGANLLVVVGTPEAIEVTRQVVNALPGQMPQGTTVSSEGYTWQLGNVIMGGSNVPPGQITVRPANKAAK